MLKLKPLYAGFITRDYIIQKGHWAEPYCRTWSCRCEWGKLEAKRGVFDWSYLDKCVADTKARGLEAMRIRFYGGVYAPDWWKAIGGPIMIENPWDNLTGGTVGGWWLGESYNAYAATIRAIRDRYESEALVREIIAGLTVGYYPEIFIRGASSQVTRDNLRKAGYTWALDKAMIKRQVEAHRGGSLRVGLQLNIPQNAETGHTDETFIPEFVAYVKARLGPRATWENTSLDQPADHAHPTGLGGASIRMYDAMKAAGQPISLQTERITNPRRIGDPDKAFAYAVSLGVSSIETQYDGQVITRDLLAKYDPLLRANAKKFA